MAKTVADYNNDTLPAVANYPAVYVLTIITLLSDKAQTMK